MSDQISSLKVIGLISGGKDSFFSLLHCLANNHRVVALVNLYPPAGPSLASEQEELNSFMYQTAGHAVIPSYSEALNLPLYRQEILGSALNQSKEYGPTSSTNAAHDSLAAKYYLDETENLLFLLRKVITAHPTANAVCSGAILSTYQRTRIESIAQRLGLIHLSYLWQYPSLPPLSPGGLLDDMRAVGFDVRLVKVASGGLDESILWGNLMDITVNKQVQKAMERFGGSVLGEGGEYETLVIDGPAPFWKGRLDVEPSERSIEIGGGGEAWIRFRGRAKVIAKTETKELLNDSGWKERIKLPGLWDQAFERLVKKISLLPSQCTSPIQSGLRLNSPEAWEAKPVALEALHTFTLYNLTGLNHGAKASAQMSIINSKLLNELRARGLSNANSVIFTAILLRTMKDFQSVNAVYGTLFTKPNPPARVTIACGDYLPLDVQVMVSFIVSLDDELLEGLHVQSRSYWAPANIGPYSQAISIPFHSSMIDPHLVYVAGQIPLVPASMEVLDKDDNTYIGSSVASSSLFQRQACLALQHLWRCGKAMNVSWWVNAVAFVIAGDDAGDKAMVAWKIWAEVHQMDLWDAGDKTEDEDGLDDFDVWDIRQGGLGRFSTDDLECACLPDFKRMPNSTSDNVPHFFAVQVDGLPRGCEIEWQSLGLAYQDSDTPTVQSTLTHAEISSDRSGQAFSTELGALLDRMQSKSSSDITIYTPHPELISELGVQVIPCRAVWGLNGNRLAAGVIIRD